MRRAVLGQARAEAFLGDPQELARLVRLHPEPSRVLHDFLVRGLVVRSRLLENFLVERGHRVGRVRNIAHATRVLRVHERRGRVARRERARKPPPWRAKLLRKILVTVENHEKWLFLGARPRPRDPRDGRARAPASPNANPFAGRTGPPSMVAGEDAGDVRRRTEARTSDGRTPTLFARRFSPRTAFARARWESGRRHRLRHVSLRAEGSVRGEAETRAESARGRSAGAVSVSRVSRVASRVRYPRTRRGADEARIRTRAAGGGHARRAGRCREREVRRLMLKKNAVVEPDVSLSRWSAQYGSVNAEASGSRSAERTAAFPSSRRARRASSRKADPVLRRPEVHRLDAARVVSPRRGTKKKKRRARRGRRLVLRGRPAGHRVRSGGCVRVWSRCVGASSDDEDDGSETPVAPPWRRQASDDGRRLPHRVRTGANASPRRAAHRGSPRCRRAIQSSPTFSSSRCLSAERVGGERQHALRLHPRGR